MEFYINIRIYYIYSNMPLFKHPQAVCMSYGTHLCLSLYFSFILWVGSIQAFIHAFLPDTFITSTTDLAHQLQSVLKSAGCH
mgnify:CR=1 FL=1|jgi:hypothetical protein